MREYSYNDFFNTLDKTGQFVLAAINGHIDSNYPQYKPFDIKPMDKSENKWQIYYRKKPKIGKAICNVYSFESKLSVRFSLLSSMTHEFLLKQSKFSDKIKNTALRQIICVANKSCRNYGGNDICAWRQFYWVNNRLMAACPYPWLHFEDCSEADIADIKQFIDMQNRHMVQNPKDVKGSLYKEVNMQRCGEVKIVDIDEIALDIDVFEIGGHVKNIERLEKYAKLYNLSPMGEKNRLWFYMSDDLVCKINQGKNEYSCAKIPSGKYAVATIEDPFDFSLSRVWNYICEYMQNSKESVHGLLLDNNENTACLARFFMENAKEYMAVYAPIK